MKRSRPSSPASGPAARWRRGQPVAYALQMTDVTLALGYSKLGLNLLPGSARAG